MTTINLPDMTSESRKQVAADLEKAHYFVSMYNGLPFDRLCMKLGFCHLVPKRDRKSGAAAPRAAALLAAIKSDKRFEYEHNFVGNRIHADPPIIWLAGTMKAKELFMPSTPAGFGEVKVWIDPSFVSKKREG